MRALYDIAAPAKLNLFLHITGRRADGYHLLQSAFMLIDWCDTLHFEQRGDGQIARTDLGPALPDEDLIVRAARALQTATGCKRGAQISVDKRIPTQAGLGGGSSDAASTLLALNCLWQLGLNRQQLSRIGLQLGADVPFFLLGDNAWVEGIGEVLTPLALPRAQVLVAKPQEGVQTQAIYSSPALKRNTNTATISGFAADPYGFGRNDLQPVAQALCPSVTSALQWLESLGLRGRMTGSGSAVFAWVPHPMLVPAAPEQLQVRLCSNLEVHPLKGWASCDS